MKFKAFLLSEKLLTRLENVGYLAFFISLVSAVRPLNSIAIILLVLTAILSRLGDPLHRNSAKEVTFFLIACSLFYLLYLLSLLYTTNYPETFRHLQLKLSLVFIPLFLWLRRPGPELRETLQKTLVSILLAAVGFCLLYACYRFFVMQAPGTVFFYHTLVSPFRHHAVLVSMVVLFALTELLENAFQKKFYVNFLVTVAVVSVLTLFLFLLSSKLMITVFTIVLCFYSLARVRKRWISVAVIATLMMAVLTVSLTKNPVSERFSDIITGDLSLINQPRFNQGTYFNGLQFRLLQWKNVGELLTENQAWIVGLSPGNAQEKLDGKYISKDMYFGTPERKEKGFLGYNTHNQFLESALQLGLVGEIVFISMIFGMILLAIKSKSLQTAFTVLVIVAFSCTEAVLETQFGLVVFAFFPFFSYFKNAALPR